MAAGFPVKQDYATGDILTAANLNDLAGTLNYMDPTAKGDLFPASDASALTRLAVGSNGQVLTADSTAATGMKWAASAGGSGSLIYVGGGSFTGSSSQSFNNVFTSTYQNYKVIISIEKSANSFTEIRLRSSGTDNTTSNYYSLSEFRQIDGAGTGFGTNSGVSSWFASDTANLYLESTFFNPQSTLNTIWSSQPTAFNYSSAKYISQVSGLFNATTSFDGFTVYPTSGTMTGNIRIYGIANS